MGGGWEGGGGAEGGVEVGGDGEGETGEGRREMVRRWAEREEGRYGDVLVSVALVLVTRGVDSRGLRGWSAGISAPTAERLNLLKRKLWV